VIDGDGDAAVVGETVEVAYKGQLDDGHIFDQAKSFLFTLGAGDVIKGWDQGVTGMKVGGVRKLVVPSTLGYGQKVSRSIANAHLEELPPTHLPSPPHPPFPSGLLSRYPSRGYTAL